MSFEGYDFKILLYRNKDTIKILAAFLVGYSYFNGFSWGAFLMGAGSLVGKIAIDSLDFFLTDVKLNQDGK